MRFGIDRREKMARHTLCVAATTLSETCRRICCPRKSRLRSRPTELGNSLRQADRARMGRARRERGSVMNRFAYTACALMGVSIAWLVPASAQQYAPAGVARAPF